MMPVGAQAPQTASIFIARVSCRRDCPVLFGGPVPRGRHLWSRARQHRTGGRWRLRLATRFPLAVAYWLTGSRSSAGRLAVLAEVDESVAGRCELSTALPVAEPGVQAQVPGAVLARKQPQRHHGPYKVCSRHRTSGGPLRREPQGALDSRPLPRYETSQSPRRRLSRPVACTPTCVRRRPPQPHNPRSGCQRPSRGC